MSQLLTDPLTGRSVILSRARASRPNEFRRSIPSSRDAAADPAPDCPFCAGSEDKTPPALHEVCDTQGRWLRRVVPNKYPVCLESAADPGPDELAGSHEVIIESPRHLLSTAQLGHDGLAQVLGVYADRLDAWRGDKRFPFRLIFKNVGPSAGASLSHLHSQFLALPDISHQLRTELDALETSQRPLTAWRERLDEELSDGKRLVAQSDRFVAFCPTVSRAPSEFWVMPREQQPWFEDSLRDPSRQRELAALLLPIITRLEERISPSGYNMILHTAPLDERYADRCWWRLEVLPRVASLAGFELGTGVLINTLPPEEAAAGLR